MYEIKRKCLSYLCTRDPYKIKIHTCTLLIYTMHIQQRLKNQPFAQAENFIKFEIM